MVEMENTTTYYLAGPGFTEVQQDRIREVEKMLDKMEVTYYSPFKKGNRLDTKVDNELLKLNVKLIFEENIEFLNQSSRLIALVDDLDKGTLFEIGYFVASLVDCDCKTTYIESRILLMGKHAAEISEWIVNLTSKLSGKKSLANLKFYLQDLNKKEERDYLTMGAMYHYQIPIITYSEKELDSNVMTACSTFAHVIGTREDALKIGKDLKLVKDKLFNLNAFKFFKKID